MNRTDPSIDNIIIENAQNEHNWWILESVREESILYKSLPALTSLVWSAPQTINDNTGTHQVQQTNIVIVANAANTADMLAALRQVYPFLPVAISTPTAGVVWDILDPMNAFDVAKAKVDAGVDITTLITAAIKQQYPILTLRPVLLLLWKLAAGSS